MYENMRAALAILITSVLLVSLLGTPVFDEFNIPNPIRTYAAEEECKNAVSYVVWSVYTKREGPRGVKAEVQILGTTLLSAETNRYLITTSARMLTERDPNPGEYARFTCTVVDGNIESMSQNK